MHSTWDPLNVAARLRAAEQAVKVGRLTDALALVDGVRWELEGRVEAEQVPTIPAPPPSCECFRDGCSTDCEHSG